MPLRPPNECYSFPLFSFFFWENEATCLLPKTYTLRLFCCKICLPACSLTYDQASLVLPFHFTRCRVKYMRKEIVGSIYSTFPLKLCVFSRFLKLPLKSRSLQRSTSLYMLRICMFLLRYSRVSDCRGNMSVWELDIQMGSFLFPSLLPSLWP